MAEFTATGGGHSLWIASFSRDFIKSGLMRELIKKDAVSGFATDPEALVEMVAGGVYDSSLAAHPEMAGADEREAAIRLIVEDVRAACDELSPVFMESGGRDGFVSIDLPPGLSGDLGRLRAEAVRVSGLTARKNLLVKVPATDAGLRAVEELTREGIGTCVTSVFSVPRYKAAAEAYLRGVAARLGEGRVLDGISSVACFAANAVDERVDKALDDRLPAGSEAEDESIRGLYGRAGVSAARTVYEAYRETFFGDRFQALAARGANVQRLCWAERGTRLPRYEFTNYLDYLQTKDTVLLLTAGTLDKIRGIGRTVTSKELVQEAGSVPERLKSLGIDLEDAGIALLDEALKSASEAFDELCGAVAARREALAKRAA